MVISLLFLTANWIYIAKTTEVAGKEREDEVPREARESEVPIFERESL